MLLLELAWFHRHDGITYSSESSGNPLVEVSATEVSVDLEAGAPPSALTVFTDASWMARVDCDASDQVQSLREFIESGAEYVPRDVISEVVLYGGAAVLCRTKTLGMHVNSSMAAEGVATARAAEGLEHALQIHRALGGMSVLDSPPPVMATDNKSNMQVAMSKGATTRARHLLRIYVGVQQQIKQGSCRVLYVPDKMNPADFLTKFLPTVKFISSLRYVCGGAYRPAWLPPSPICSGKAEQRRARRGVNEVHTAAVSGLWMPGDAPPSVFFAVYLGGGRSA